MKLRPLDTGTLLSTKKKFKRALTNGTMCREAEGRRVALRFEEGPHTRKLFGWEGDDVDLQWGSDRFDPYAAVAKIRCNRAIVVFSSNWKGVSLSILWWFDITLTGIQGEQHHHAPIQCQYPVILLVDDEAPKGEAALPRSTHKSKENEIHPHC